MEYRDGTLRHVDNPIMIIKSESTPITNKRSYLDRPFSFRELVSRIRNRDLIAGLLLVFLVATFGVSLTMQGWRSRIPAPDLVPHVHNARNLAAMGAIPIHGDTGSYGSYKPPGTAWLMLPSTLLFSDPRLSEYAGTAFLHFATLLGIFLLAYRNFGFWSACLAVLIYGVSSNAIFLGGSLWPNGRPDFFVWFIYFLSQWVIHRDAKHLAIAVAIWAVGMNVDMAILPVIFILPALWLVYRPPVRHKSLIVAIGLILLVWSPYLRFEAGRDFADVRSQIFFQNIFPADYRKTWCDSNIQLRELGNTAAVLPINSIESQPYKGPNLVVAALAFTNEMRAKFIYNFQDATSIPTVSVGFLLIVLCSLILLNVTGHRPETNAALGAKIFWRDWTTRLAFAMILFGVLTNEVVIAHLFGIRGGLELSTIRSLRTIEKLFILGGGCILACKWITTFVDCLLMKIKIPLQNQEHAKQVKVLVLSLAIPWFVLLLVAEPGKPERFWWLWPVQAIFLAGFITWILPRFRISPLFISVFSVITIAVIARNPFLLSRINDWRQNGWAGKDAPEVQVINYLSSEIKSEGKEQAAIGYHFFVYQFMAAYNITNPQYKVGSDFDLLFKYPYHITNTDQCAEGLSPSDEYRVVQTKPKNEAWAPRMYFDVPINSNFRLVSQFGPYQVFKRQ